jgi:hypothetical protein
MAALTNRESAPRHSPVRAPRQVEVMIMIRGAKPFLRTQPRPPVNASLRP